MLTNRTRQLTALITALSLVGLVLGCQKTDEPASITKSTESYGTPVPESPTSATSSAIASAPTPVPAPAPPISLPAEGLTAETLIKNASFANSAWTDHPDWKYINNVKGNLLLTPRNIGVPEVTSVRVPLKKGSYKLTASGLLDEKASGPADLAINMLAGGKAQPVLQQKALPGATFPIDCAIELPENGEVELSITLSPETQNNWNSTIYLRVLKLVSAEKK